MMFIKQTDPGLPGEFHRYGCRYMCLYTIPQIFAGLQISDKDCLADYIRLKKNPEIVGIDMLTGLKEHLIISTAFDRLRYPYRGAQIGVIEDGKTTKWGWAKNYKVTYKLLHWATNGADGHYTIAAPNGIELYDPHDPVEAGYAIDKKHIIRELLYSVWEKPL